MLAPKVRAKNFVFFAKMKKLVTCIMVLSQLTWSGLVILMLKFLQKRCGNIMIPIPIIQIHQ